MNSVRSDTQAPEYATSQDFQQIFTDGVDSLYQLAFLLTADHEKAEQCFVAGLEEAIRSNEVFRDWARPWARRTIIKHAIAGVQPLFRRAPESSDLGSTSTFTSDSPLGVLLALEDFDRIVFVLSVLEHYSVHDCALLLGSSALNVRGARIRAFERIAHSAERSTSAVASHHTYRDEDTVERGKAAIRAHSI